MRIDEHNEMIKRAESKKDGVYAFKYNFYLVIDKQLAAYSDLLGNITERSYGFGVSKGKAKDRFEARDILKSYLKQFKNK